MPPTRPSPSTISELCAKYGDESRLPILQEIAANGPKMPVSAPAEPAVAGVTPSSMTSVPPTVAALHGSPVVQPEAIRPAVPIDDAPALAAAVAAAATAASPAVAPAANAEATVAAASLVKPTPSAGPAPAPKFSSEEVAMLGEAVPFAQYTAAHERALAYMRWRRDDAVAKEAALAPSPEMASDIRLWRFLVAKQFDCEGAAEMYLASLRWRAESGLDKVRARLIAANAGFFAQGGPALDTLMIDPSHAACDAVYPRLWTKPRASPDAPHEPMYDRQGNVIYIECPGIVNMPDVVPLGLPAFSAYVHANQELLQLVLDELSRRAGRLILTLRVLDMKDVTLVKMFQSKADKEGEKIVKDAGRPMADNYPSTTYKNFLINLPAANVAAPIVKNFAPARSAKKMVLLGAKYFEEIGKEADASNLPRKLGGILDDGTQWEKRKK